MKSKDWLDIGDPDIGLTIGDPNIGLTVGDPNIGLTVSRDALKDDFYKRHKRLTKKQLTDAMYELEVENIGLNVKMGVYDDMFNLLK